MSPIEMRNLSSWVGRLFEKLKLNMFYMKKGFRDIDRRTSTNSIDLTKSIFSREIAKIILSASVWLCNDGVKMGLK